MDRSEELKTLLGLDILQKIDQGQSLEKYKAVLDDQTVLLRIYDDSYYANRFLREGMILRQLRVGENVLAPAIVDEWPEYQIRAIEWFNFEESDITNDEFNSVHNWIKSQDVRMPYRLETDVVHHLLDTSQIHEAYFEFYMHNLEQMLQDFNWGEGKQGLVHGDLHTQNIGKTEEYLVVYDWEYASFGSEYYDLAYYHLTRGNLNISRIPQSWSYLVAMTNLHWYLQENTFSPKEAIKWVDIVGTFARKS